MENNAAFQGKGTGLTREEFVTTELVELLTMTAPYFLLFNISAALELKSENLMLEVDTASGDMTHSSAEVNDMGTDITEDFIQKKSFSIVASETYGSDAFPLGL